jgi:apolipoprotein N-acyltransferase
MYIAWGAMTFYLACYWPLFVGLTRVAVQRYGLSLTLAAPILWTGLEFLRAHLFTGFAWYQLGHTQYRWVEIIQISDLVGGYGVTFLVVMANACLAEHVPTRWLTGMGLQKPGEEPELAVQGWRHPQWRLAVMLILVVASWGYGVYRQSSVQFINGPRVALIQGNFPAYVRSGMTAEEVFEEWNEIYRTHRYLTGLTVPEQPDLIVWPEVMFRYPLLQAEADLTEEELAQGHADIPARQWQDPTTREILADMAREAGATMIVGVDAHELTRKQGYRHFNSAVLLDPEVGIKGRYDKIHRVIFGEYIPLRETLPVLQKLTPYSGDFGIHAGRSVSVFDAKIWRMVPVICFEDTVPHLIRNMVHTVESRGPEQVDCLVNLSNDGWFWGSCELDQHLITAQFRCVETRTPMVRAVNTGISAIIDGDGVVREPEHFKDLDARLTGEPPRESMRDPRTGRYQRQLNCALVGNVPLDPRKSLYVAWGDWFGLLCMVCCLGTGLTGLLLRARSVPLSATSAS